MDMRRAVPWVASIASFMAILILTVTWVNSPDHAEVYRSVAIDFAVSLLDLAITVGIVDLLLNAYSERQRFLSIAPRAQEFVQEIDRLHAAQGRYLGNPTGSDLERYRRLAVDVAQSAFDLHLLMGGGDAVLASELLRFSHRMKAQVEAAEDAILFLKNASSDSSDWIEKVRDGSKDLAAAADQLNDKLRAQYKGSRGDA
jgi:hypothetical protein